MKLHWEQNSNGDWIGRIGNSNHALKFRPSPFNCLELVIIDNEYVSPFGFDIAQKVPDMYAAEIAFEEFLKRLSDTWRNTHEA